VTKVGTIPSTEADRPSNQDVEITEEMIEAGVSVLADLEGEVSRAFLAREVYRAMASARCDTTMPASD
jgi:hypothetical protein